MRDRELAVKDLPFLKRFAFAHEHEFRLIFESESDKVPSLDIPIPLSCIDRITLSPWIHESLAFYLKKLLWSIDKCSKMKIVRSTLIGNEEWKNLGESAV